MIYYSAFEEIETFEANSAMFHLFASLSFAANMTLPETQLLMIRLKNLKLKSASNWHFTHWNLAN